MPLELNITPHELLLYHKKASSDRAGSPIQDTSHVEEFLAATQAPNFTPNMGDFITFINKIISAPPFDQSEEYRGRITQFYDYITAKSGAGGETPQAQTTLIQSVCNFFLRCGDIDPESLSANFPPPQEELLCFDGTSERLDRITTFKDPVLALLHESYLTLLPNFQRLIRLTLPGNETHVMRGLDEILNQSTNPTHSHNDQFVIPAAELLWMLNCYPEKMHAEFARRLAEVFENIEKHSNADLVRLLKFVDLSTIPQRTTATITATFIGDLKKSILEEFSSDKDVKKVLNGEYIEDEDTCFAVSTKVNDFVKEYAKKLPALVEEEISIFENTDKGLTFNSQLAFQITSRKKEEFFDQEKTKQPFDFIAAYRNPKYLTERLLSKNLFEAVEAVNTIYCFSKVGFDSCVLLAYNPEIIKNAKALKGKLMEKLMEPPPNRENEYFLQKHLFKLNTYLQRLETGGVKNFLQDPLIAQILGGKIAEIDFSEIDNGKLLFILCNLSGDDAKVFLSKIDEEKFLSLFSNPSNTNDFGVGVSAYNFPDLLWSFFLRPDLSELFEKLLSRECSVGYLNNLLNIKYENRHEQGYNFLTLALEHLTKEECQSLLQAIKPKLSKYEFYSTMSRSLKIIGNKDPFNQKSFSALLLTSPVREDCITILFNLSAGGVNDGEIRDKILEKCTPSIISEIKETFPKEDHKVIFRFFNFKDALSRNNFKLAYEIAVTKYKLGQNFSEQFEEPDTEEFVHTTLYPLRCESIITLIKIMQHCQTPRKEIITFVNEQNLLGPILYKEPRKFEELLSYVTNIDNGKNRHAILNNVLSSMFEKNSFNSLSAEGKECLGNAIRSVEEKFNITSSFSVTRDPSGKPLLNKERSCTIS